MDRKLIALILSFLITSALQANDSFIVSPFIIIGNNSRLNLNFQTAKDAKLNIEVEIKNKKTFKTDRKFFSQKYKMIDLQKIDLGTLQCDNVLHYKISSGTKVVLDRGLYSIPCSKSEPLYFGFMSDTQIKDEKGQKRADTLSATISDLRKTYPFSLIINAGDITQHGGRDELWLNFFDTAKGYLYDSYLMAAVGNHEYYDAPTYDRAPAQFLKYLRDVNSNELGYSSIDLGRLSILMINSNFDFMTEGKIREEFEWLEHKIIENEKIGKPVIVTMHHSPFSSSAEWVREIPTRLRNELVPMLERHKNVKLMISGHLHMYERSFKSGIHYVVAGPSGGIVNYVTYKNPYQVMIKPFSTTFTIFKVTETEAQVITYSGLKEVLDQFTVSFK